MYIYREVKKLFRLKKKKFHMLFKGASLYMCIVRKLAKSKLIYFASISPSHFLLDIQNLIKIKRNTRIVNISTS